MTEKPRVPRRRGRPRLRALVEVVFIIFLFYANLLMGEYNRSARHGQTLHHAIADVVTPENLLIAVITAFLGYGVIELVRRKL